MLSRKIKKYIEDNIHLIEQYKFDELYNNLLPHEDRGVLTETLIEAQISPISYFKTRIPFKSYTNVSSITEVTIPEGIEEIALKAFDGCVNLREVHLPVSIETVHYRAFNSCSVLENVYYSGTSAEWRNVKCATEAFRGTKVKQIVCSDTTVEWKGTT